ncbi:hypothetical protein LXL04_011481 [Taraxacum kok-saghyz]
MPRAGSNSLKLMHGTGLKTTPPSSSSRAPEKETLAVPFPLSFNIATATSLLRFFGDIPSLAATAKATPAEPISPVLMLFLFFLATSTGPIKFADFRRAPVHRRRSHSPPIPLAGEFGTPPATLTATGHRGLGGIVFPGRLSRFSGNRQPPTATTSMVAEADDIGFPAKGGHRRRARASENSVLNSGTERWISHYEGDRPRGKGAVEVYSGEGSHKTLSHTAGFYCLWPCCVAVLFQFRRVNLVYGGGSVGLMGMISHRVFDGGCHVIGIIPKALVPLKHFMGVALGPFCCSDVIHFHRDSVRHTLPTDDALSYTTHC